MRNTTDVTSKLNSHCSLCLGNCSRRNLFLLDSSGLPPLSNIFPGRCPCRPVMPDWALSGPLLHCREMTSVSPGATVLVLTMAVIRASIPNICLCWHLGSCCPLWWSQRALLFSLPPWTSRHSLQQRLRDGPGEVYHPVFSLATRYGFSHSLQVSPTIPSDASSLLSHIILPCLITACSFAKPHPPKPPPTPPVSIFQRHSSSTIYVYP